MEVATMHRPRHVAAAAAFASLLALPLLAQEAAKPAQPPKPAAKPADALIGALNYEGGKLLAMAQDFPEDKYDYKPNPAQRSFAEQLLHVAGSNYAFTNAALGKKAEEQNFTRDKYKTKADVVAAVKRSFDDMAAAVRAKGDAGLNNEVNVPWGNHMMRVSEFGYSFVTHAAEHYGQLVVYYRVLNMVPPESRPH
jgi:uncharacterized damage-inducible protein DinB